MTNEERSEWRWSVEGRQVAEGTLERGYAESGVVRAESGGEVVAWLAESSPIWDNIDQGAPFSIAIYPPAAGVTGSPE